MKTGAFTRRAPPCGAALLQSVKHRAACGARPGAGCCAPAESPESAAYTENGLACFLATRLPSASCHSASVAAGERPHSGVWGPCSAGLRHPRLGQSVLLAMGQ